LQLAATNFLLMSEVQAQLIDSVPAVPVRMMLPGASVSFDAAVIVATVLLTLA
jgi:hypothetical protein